MAADGAVDDDQKLFEAEWASQGLADLFDQANAPIFALDLNGLVTEWNNRMSDLTGHSKESVMGKPLSDQVGQTSLQMLKDGLAASARGEVVPVFEVQLNAAGGEKDVKISAGLSPQFGSARQVIGALCIAQVIPEPLEQSPATAASPTEEAAGASSDLNRKTKGMVMHELRSPLHGIIGLANTLSQDETPLQKPLKMIGTSAERVLELVTNLMDYWNLSEDTSTDLVQDAIDISVIINESLARCEQSKDKRGKPMKKDKVTINKELAKSIPAFMGDQQAVSQMVYHLILNALKFTHQGQVRIAAEHNTSKNSIDIVVEDTGIGINKVNFKRIFEPFQQEDTSESRKYEGIGLGLAIVREVVRIHSGSVNIESTQGKGSMLAISLPAAGQAALPERGPAAPGGAARAGAPSARAAKPRSGPRPKPGSWLGPSSLAKPAEPPARPKAAARAAPAPGHGQGQGQGGGQGQDAARMRVPKAPPPQEGLPKVIMSVDDDHVNQEVMRSVLEPCGFSMIVCMSGTECLEYMQKGNTIMPDLILLDLMMPGINGFDVLTEQRKKYTAEELPIIMVSAKNQASSVVKGLELGCNDWIHKPFDRQELIARVQSHLKWRDNMLHMQHLMASMGDEAAAAPVVPAAKPKPAAHFVPINSPIDTSVLFVIILHEPEGEAIMTRLFEMFEVLSEQHDAVRTEVIGSWYIAVAKSTDTETRHADKMLQLALQMEEAISQLNRESNFQTNLQFKVGIHTDSHVPPVIDGRKGHCLRQYPTSSFYSSTVRGAKRLAEVSPSGNILLSRSARCRLSADIENEMQDRGLQMISRSESKSVSTLGADHFILTKAGSTAALEDSNENTAEVRTQSTAQMEAELRNLHSELQSSRGQLTSTHQRLSASEEQLAGSKAEVRTLRMQIDDLTSRVPRGGQQQKGLSSGSLPQMPRAAPNLNISFPNANGGGAESAASVPPSTASTLFLQWQNAHLQAELRYYTEALAMAKGQLQIQTMRSQAMEKVQGSLQERIEHLELDLGFKAACTGFLGPGMGGMGPPGGSSLSGAGLHLGGNDALSADAAGVFGGAGMGMAGGLPDVGLGLNGGLGGMQAGAPPGAGGYGLAAAPGPWAGCGAGAAQLGAAGAAPAGAAAPPGGP